VDIRAVNHRFFDLKIRGAHVGPASEDAIARILRGTGIERGAITVSIHVTRPTTAAHLDHDAARATYAALAALAAELAMPRPDLALVLAQPGVVHAAPTADAHAADPDADADAIAAATTAAAAALGTMRAAEGAALAADLAAQLAELAAARTRLAELAAAVPAQLQRRLADRLARLLADAGPTPVDPARLAHEVALLADRADVAEELVRLTSHLDQAGTLIAEPRAAVGRRLDFLVQEIGRELNTIGSKSALAEITTVVVDAKAALERLREQVQNVE
jgi:uncharacterized protein (TIGR00255 family)